MDQQQSAGHGHACRGDRGRRGVFARYIKSPPTGIRQPVYFYDLESGERFVGKLGNHPPTAAPSGPGNGVRVQVFGCGSCEEEKLVNGYLEKLTPEGREAAVQKDKLTDIADEAEALRLAGIIEKNTRIRAMDSERWVPANSREGIQIRAEAARKACEGVVALPCRPGQKSMF